MTEAPEAAAAREEIEKLAQAIRANPGQAQGELLAAVGLAEGKDEGDAGTI